MNLVHKSRIAVAATAMLVGAALAGCGNEAARQTVEQRAQARWDALIAHQADKAYDYLTPGYRQTHARDKYVEEMNNRPVRWQNAKVNGKECDGDRCSVEVVVGYNVPLNPSMGAVKSLAPQKETWLRVKGVWYFLPSS